MARKHNRMDNNYLSVSTPVEEDTLTTDDGWIFKITTSDVVLHTAITQYFFEVTIEDVVNKKTTVLGKYSINQGAFKKILNDEDRKWMARNIHYHLKAVIDGDMDTFTLGEWVNVKALVEVLKQGARDLLTDTSPAIPSGTVESVVWL